MGFSALCGQSFVKARATRWFPWPGFSLFLSAMVMWSVAAYAAEAPLCLLEALRLARENDPTVRSAYHEYQAVRTLPNQARSALLPTIQGSFTLTDIS